MTIIIIMMTGSHSCIQDWLSKENIFLDFSYFAVFLTALELAPTEVTDRALCITFSSFQIKCNSERNPMIAHRSLTLHREERQSPDFCLQLPTNGIFDRTKNANCTLVDLDFHKQWVLLILILTLEQSASHLLCHMSMIKSWCDFSWFVVLFCKRTKAQRIKRKQQTREENP